MNKIEIKEFCDQAVSASVKYGPDAAVLIVGSRGAGYVDSWSDLDLWILGDKSFLSGNDAQDYSVTGQNFFDRGDLEAHYTFYDIKDIEHRLLKWPDELMWLIQRSQILHDPAHIAEKLKARFVKYPDNILEEKLKWWLCKYSESCGRLGVAGRNMPASAVLIASKCIESACKICCLADGWPFPYFKWLRRVAGETRLGHIVCPVIDKAVNNMNELIIPPAGVSFRDFIPVKELRALKPVLCQELNKMGWQGDWVMNPGHYVWILFNHKYND